MLPDAEEIDAQLIGENRFIDDVADHLRMRQQVAIGPRGDIAERIQPKLNMPCHQALYLR
jgi:hypothetical protein